MKRILVLNFFPAFVPPQSGGELRYFNMYLNLSKYFDVTLLSPTYREHKFEVIYHSETFREYRVPKEEIHDKLHMEIGAEHICDEISALVCSLSAGYFNQYHKLYQELYPNSDIIIHEFPYMLDYDLFFGLDSKLRIYNSHNFESDLVRQMWKGPNADKYLMRILEAEKKLVQNCDLVFATSEEEKVKFIDLLGGSEEKIKLAPNGISIELYDTLRINKKENSTKKAFFIGSGHPPNVEAMRFIINDIAPQCPEIEFQIAGKCCDFLQSTYCNVKLLGLVDEKQKDMLFQNADIAINPMFSGAGTNLKTLEYLSAGIPMISTSTGVRGLGLIDGEHYIKAEREDFCDKLKRAIKEPKTLRAIAENGKTFINEHYSWRCICESIRKEIDTLKKENNESQKKSLLVLNDYPVNKPISGGEVRCYSLLKELTKMYNIVFVCLNGENYVKKEMLFADGLLTHISLPKQKEHLEEERKVNSKSWISANDIVTAYMIDQNIYVKHVVAQLYENVDAVILEHPYMVRLISYLKGRPVIYESHNFEFQLKKQLLSEHPLKDKLLSEVATVEKIALQKCRLLISVSEEEIPALEKMVDEKEFVSRVIKNGVQIPNKKYDYDIIKNYLGKPLIIFVGSGHTPNIDASKYILHAIAPQITEAYFGLSLIHILGSMKNVWF